MNAATESCAIGFGAGIASAARAGAAAAAFGKIATG